MNECIDVSINQSNKQLIKLSIDQLIIPSSVIMIIRSTTTTVGRTAKKKKIRVQDWFKCDKTDLIIIITIKLIIYDRWMMMTLSS